MSAVQVDHAMFKTILDDEERTLIRQAAHVVSRYDLVDEPERFVMEAQVQAAYLPERIRRVLVDFRRFGNSTGALLITGIPIGEIPSTPQRPEFAIGMTPLAASAMSVVVAPLGDQVGYRPEFGGRIIQSVLPVVGSERLQISTGATVDLETHIEMAFSDHRSDYVVLLAVRQDHERCAGTTVSSIDRMIPTLDARTIEVLRQPRFRTKVDQSFLNGSALERDVWIEPIQILYGSETRPMLRVDFAETEAYPWDLEGQRAIERLREAAISTRIVVQLAPGDLLITDNRRALHGRTPFTPRYDGADRWLLRTFVTKNLALSEHVRPNDGRIIEPDYAAA